MKYERKTLSPLNAQIDKKIVLYICCDTLFVVVLTLHSARMLPKIYNLRSKGKWFLVRSPSLSLFPPTCCCMSKLVLQSRAGVRWKDWQEDPVLREKFCVSRQFAMNFKVKMIKIWTLNAASGSEMFADFISLSCSSSGWFGGKEP